jgi:prepilin-type N-terminal cleavage/methylation domain-containing protein
MKMFYQNSNNMHGFSLVEMAVVLVILGFVIAALLLPLAAQREQSFQTETENQLEIARKALLGFAQSKGRLPCPATATSNIDPGSYGIESPVTGGDCTGRVGNVVVGYLPAATLGIQPADDDGFAIDAWNNRIRYAVTQVNTSGGSTTPDFTTSNELSNLGISVLAPNLQVCDNSSNCSGTVHLINNAVVVVYSTGKNGPLGIGPDETANLNNDTIFYSRIPTSLGSANGEFDDLVVWFSPYVLYNAMIEAGQLH